MNIAFRVDSSDLIGAGHVRRCLELAEKLRKKCDKVIFITKNLNGNFNGLIKKKNFKVVLIRNIISNNKLIYDFRDTKNVCQKFKINTLIIDHYHLGMNWEKKIKHHINKLIVIDDFSKKKHYCDLIINNLRHKKLNATKNLTGLKYLIVPGSFSKKKIKNKSKKITIGTFFGSTDRMNCTARILKIFSQNEFQHFRFISILGKNNKHKEKIQKNFGKYRNLYIEKKFIKMNDFFKKIDILITVGGVTSFEALLSNVKCIYIPINYYQKMTCEFLKKKKISNVLRYDKVFSKKGKQLLINCLNKTSKEKSLSRKKIYLDYFGSRRITNYILGKKFDCRIGVS